MSLLKKFSLFIFLVMSAGFSRASGPQLAYEPVSSSDTAIVDDSIKGAVALNDPKKAFKDLFIASTEKKENYSVQLNPMAISFVQGYMGRHTKQLNEMKDWGKPYFDMMEGILNAHGLPGELKYLAVIESNLKSNASSWAGAAGQSPTWPRSG